MAAAFVQGKVTSFGAGPFQTIQVTFNTAQTNGNLIVFTVKWSTGTGSISSVTDSAGNTYIHAVGPTVTGGVASQDTWYSAGIQGTEGPTTITAEFSTAAIGTFINVAIGEWSGTSQSTDGALGAAGTSIGPADSGGITTVNGTDLLIGAGFSTGGAVTGAGAGYVSRAADTNIILEDQSVAVTGTYHATFTIGSSQSWSAQIIAFKLATVTPVDVPESVYSTTFGVSRIGVA